MRYLLTLCLLLAGPAALAETYKWSEGGKTVISDTPPPGKAKSVSKAGVTADTGDNLPFAVKKAMDAFPVTLYSSADCINECKQARDLLNGRGVPFTEKMVQSQAEIDELKQLVGEAMVPSLKVGNQRFKGFDAAGYGNLLDLAGYPKTAPYGSKPSGGLSQ